MTDAFDLFQQVRSCPELRLDGIATVNSLHDQVYIIDKILQYVNLFENNYGGLICLPNACSAHVKQLGFP